MKRSMPVVGKYVCMLKYAHFDFVHALVTQQPVLFALCFGTFTTSNFLSTSACDFSFGLFGFGSFCLGLLTTSDFPHF